jgi:ArsR family transcriptional regulator
MTTPDERLNRILQAVRDPNRRRILVALKERGGCSIGKDVGLCASDIELRVKLSQPTISHHMAVLERAGLVEARKVGQWRWYKRNENTLKEFARTLKDRL